MSKDNEATVKFLMEYNGNYHHQKDNIVWQVTSLYLVFMTGLASFSLAYLKKISELQTLKFVLVALISVTAIAGFIFIREQFKCKFEAANKVNECLKLLKKKDINHQDVERIIDSDVGERIVYKNWRNIRNEASSKETWFYYLTLGIIYFFTLAPIAILASSFEFKVIAIFLAGAFIVLEELCLGT